MWNQLVALDGLGDLDVDRLPGRREEIAEGGFLEPPDAARGVRFID